MSEPYSFRELYTELLNDLFSAETQIHPVLPKVISYTSSGELRETFTLYKKEIELHLQHLNEVIEESKPGPKNYLCKAVEGILEEIDNAIPHGGNSAVKDAAFISIIQRLQHYKMAVYGTARTYARHLNESKAMDSLQRALNEEAEMDKKLTKLAEGGLFTTGINEEAIKELPLPVQDSVV